MSRRTRSGTLQTAQANAPAPAYSSNIKFLQFLIAEYGNFDFVIDVADNLINFARRFRKDSKRYHAALSVLKYGIPAAVVTAQLAAKIKKYMQIKEGKNSLYNEFEAKVRSIMGAEDDNISISQDNFMLGKDVYNWLFQNPKTESFKILGFYSCENLQPIVDIWSTESRSVLASIEFEGSVYAWNILLSNNPLTEEIYVRESGLYYALENVEKKLCVKAAIYKEFINHFDTRNNVVVLDTNGLTVRPRKDMSENISQFNVDRFVSEITKVLERKKKRGFAFVGVPGTGKSTIIRKLEKLVLDYPILYTTAANYSSHYEIIDTFRTIEYVQPCIVVMEDLDSYDLRDKKSNLGIFLDAIDDINHRLNAVFISTINDTSLVHYTLINRPGRFDQVIMIKTPQTIEEVYSVMTTRYNMNKKSDPAICADFLSFDKIDKNLLSEIIKEQYTQADICEIVEKATLISEEISNYSLKQSLSDLKESKDAIKKCNFGGEDPRNCSSEVTHADEPQAKSMAGYPSIGGFSAR